MIGAYLDRNKYNVFNDYLDYKKRDLLYKYKKSVLEANNNGQFVKDLPDFSAKFSHVNVDSQGIEISPDVTEHYPIGLDEEKQQISLRLQNIEYLRRSRDIFEKFRTTCKVSDSRLRNYVALPTENQMCLTDCLNVRYELYLPQRPENTDKAKKLVWTA
jgi:hypothetical protein